MSATILIVEDEFAVARGIQYALQQEGYQVAVARSGEEGLDLAVNQAPDLIVLDIRLPGIDGFEVLRRLRAAGSKAPVRMLTARDDEIDKVIGLELGADDYVTTPFGLRELKSRIKAPPAGVRRPRRCRRRRVSATTTCSSISSAGASARLTADRPHADGIRDPPPPRQPARPRLHPTRAAGAPARLRGPRPGREDDQRPHQPPAREDRGRSDLADVRPDRPRSRVRVRRALGASSAAPGRDPSRHASPSPRSGSSPSPSRSSASSSSIGWTTTSSPRPRST